MNDPAERLFEANPRRLAKFREVRRFIEGLGNVEARPTKAQVAFAAKRGFAWVWLPIRVTPTRPEDCIVLSFALKRRVEDRRIAEATEPRPGRWMHHVVLVRQADFDRQVKAWLQEAYALAGAPPNRTSTNT